MAEANDGGNLDNSGRGPLRVPGFGGIPVDYQLPLEQRFAHGVREWRQSPMLTAQELAMVAVMDRLTDTPTWFVDVFDDAIVARWQAELEREDFTTNPRLMKGRTWAWCVQELRDKAVFYEEHQYIRALDTGTCVCKADSAELRSLSAVFRRAVLPLAYQYKADQERHERRKVLKKTQTIQFGEEANAGADSVSDVGRQAQADDHEPTTDGHTVNDDAHATEESEESTHTTLDAQSTFDNSQTVEGEHRAEDQNITRHPNVLEDYADDALTEYMLMSDDVLTDLSDMEDDQDEDGNVNDWTNSYGNRNIQTHPAHEGRALDIAVSAHMICSLVDPLLFPLVYGRTLVLQHGGIVTLENMLASYSAAQPAPRQIPERPELLDTAGENLLDFSPWSRRYQSLACEISFVGDGGNSHNITDVKITSYINGIHPDHTEMYRAIEQVLSRTIQPWNDCLVRGHRGLYDWSNLGQLGPVPARIITYGVEWENELPDWATAFRVPTRSRRQSFHEQWKKLQQLPEGSKTRKREEGYLRSMFSDVIGKEDEKLPLRDSDLWHQAKEYLARPEGQPDPERSSRAESLAIPENWDVGDERTWDILCEKARRLLSHKHPEPGTAFSYEDWKLGRHESRPIVDKAVQEPSRNEARRAPVTPPHTRYSVALQDRFQDRGLQVLVEISSIELTPETPAYAPDAAALAAANATRMAEKFAKAMSSNTSVELDGDRDGDGWRLPGQMNEHIVAVAVFAFDVENVTEPRLAFRQRTSLDHRLHRFDECSKQPESASDYHDYLTDGPAHLIGKESDASALAEILGIPWLGLGGYTTVYPYQHIGSAAMRQGRLVAFPNVLEHRIEPFHLIDSMKPGRYRWLTLYLVDPNYRVCSTRNVPPQQHDWWATAVGDELAAAAGLSRETIDRIMQDTGSWPMGMDEAEWHREQLVEEHRQSESYRLRDVGWRFTSH